MKFSLPLVIFVFFAATFTLYSQNTANDSLYVLLDKKSNLINFKTVKDSTRSSFNILKYKFRAKQKREECLKKNKQNPNFESFFYINFFSSKKPSLKKITKRKFYTIEDLSKETFRFGTRVFFVEHIHSNVFLVYEAFQLAQE